MNEETPSIKTTLARSTILACFLAGPSLVVFLAAYHILDDALVAGIAGGIVHFIALGFSLKIYKKIAGFKI